MISQLILVFSPKDLRVICPSPRRSKDSLRSLRRQITDVSTRLRRRLLCYYYDKLLHFYISSAIKTTSLASHYYFSLVNLKQITFDVPSLIFCLSLHAKSPRESFQSKLSSFGSYCVDLIALYLSLLYTSISSVTYLYV